VAEDRSILPGQRELFRQLLDLARGGRPLKVLAAEMGVSESAVRNYRDGINLVSLPVLWALARIASAEQLSLLLPDGLALVAVPEGIDHAALAGATMDYLARYTQARHEASEAGTAIGPGEAEALERRAARVRAV
jgi:transcriptional regulator with XRE-family HTH domain